MFHKNFARLLGASFLVASILPASAHVTLETKSATAGSGYKAVFRVGHGCEGSPTRRLSVSIPDGFVNAKPMPKAGWTIETSRAAYAAPRELWGKPVSEGVTRIVWSGTLSDENYDEFVVNGYVSRDAPGTELPFPVVQECDVGAHRWVEIAPAGVDPHSLKEPAPVVRIAAGESAAAAPTVKVGSLELGHVWLREPPPAAKTAGGYLSIHNSGSTPDTLQAVEATIAGPVEIHQMSQDNGIMTMRALAGGLEIKPGETVVLKPGGLHIMFMGLKQPLKSGETVPATLIFEKAGRVPVTFMVEKTGEAAGHEAGHQHGAEHK